jgi:hypothetical protein
MFGDLFALYRTSAALPSPTMRHRRLETVPRLFNHANFKSRLFHHTSIPRSIVPQSLCGDEAIQGPAHQYFRRVRKGYQRWHRSSHIILTNWPFDVIHLHPSKHNAPSRILGHYKLIRPFSTSHFRPPNPVRKFPSRGVVHRPPRCRGVRVRFTHEQPVAIPIQAPLERPTNFSNVRGATQGSVK